MPQLSGIDPRALDAAISGKGITQVVSPQTTARVPDSRPGRKPVPTRAVLEAVLWILNTGAQWQFLPQCYPNYKTVHRRFPQWCQREVLREVLTHLANTLREEGAIDERESFIDATFAAAKGGGEAVGLTKRGKGVKTSRSWIGTVAPLGQYACRPSS